MGALDHVWGQKAGALSPGLRLWGHRGLRAKAPPLPPTEHASCSLQLPPPLTLQTLTNPEALSTLMALNAGASLSPLPRRRSRGCRRAMPCVRGVSHLPCPDLAQAGASLAFFPEALAQQVSVRACAQGSFSPGPRPCQEDTSPGPRGSREGPEPSRPQGLPCSRSPFLCLWQALPQNSIPAAGWVLAEEPGQAGVSAAPLASAQDQHRPALRAHLCPS